jgi:tetratricopeptide (TPR) repeat protein
MWFLGFPMPSEGAERYGESQDWVRYVEKDYRSARLRLEEEWTVQNAVDFIRAAFDRAEIAVRSEERAAVAQEGIHASRQLLAEAPKLAAAHYYYGMNVAQLARTRRIGALKLVGDMEQAFETARELDETFDYAGPDRNLGLLYLEAPGWPLSIGNRSKARKHLERAVALAPEYPENRLNLLEAYLKWGHRAQAKREASELERRWAEARKKFAGPHWAGAWADWEERWDAIMEKLQQPGAPMERPRTP